MKKTAAVVSMILLIPALHIAQGPPASPVKFTEAREQEVRSAIKLPGTIESRAVSRVASEVAGLVQDLPGREGRTIYKDQVLARLHTEDLELRLQSLTARLKESESRLELARRGLTRAKDLFHQEVVSQEQLDAATFETSAWEGRVEADRAEMARVKRDLERSVVRAPFAGIVVSEATEIGEWISVGDPVVELLSLDELEVRVDVPERYFPSMSANGEAVVTIDSLAGFEVAGRISAIIPRADSQSRTFPVKVRIPNKEGRMGAGMLAHVSLPAGESYRATVVPKDAVVTQGKERMVYLLNDDTTVTPVPVETGEGVGVWVVVRGDLRAGQRVVTRGNERIFPGMKVAGEPLEYAKP